MIYRERHTVSCSYGLQTVDGNITAPNTAHQCTYLEVELYQLDFFLVRMDCFTIHPCSFFSLRDVGRDPQTCLLLGKAVPLLGRAHWATIKKVSIGKKVIKE